MYRIRYKSFRRTQPTPFGPPGRSAIPRGAEASPGGNGRLGRFLCNREERANGGVVSFEMPPDPDEGARRRSGRRSAIGRIRCPSSILRPRRPDPRTGAVGRGTPGGVDRDLGRGPGHRPDGPGPRDHRGREEPREEWWSDRPAVTTDGWRSKPRTVDASRVAKGVGWVSTRRGAGGERPGSEDAWPAYPRRAGGQRP